MTSPRQPSSTQCQGKPSQSLQHGGWGLRPPGEQHSPAEVPAHSSWCPLQPGHCSQPCQVPLLCPGPSCPCLTMLLLTPVFLQLPAAVQGPKARPLCPLSPAFRSGFATLTIPRRVCQPMVSSPGFQSLLCTCFKSFRRAAGDIPWLQCLELPQTHPCSCCVLWVTSLGLFIPRAS